MGLDLSAQDDCVTSSDFNQDGVVGMNDLLILLSAFGDFDLDFDGVWDSVDACIGVVDPCGVCNGTGEDNDEDGLCDDVDDCVGAYDECGVCNGPGPTIPVIDEIIYVTDSVFIESLDEWQVFEYAADTLYNFVCPLSGCTDEYADNYNPSAIIEDGSCRLQLGQDIDGEAANDNSGYSVSLSSDGTVVAIGAIGNDGNGSDSGHTVFTRGTGAVGVNSEVTSTARRRVIFRLQRLALLRRHRSRHWGALSMTATGLLQARVFTRGTGAVGVNWR